MIRDKTIILIAIASVIVGILVGAVFWGRTGPVSNQNEPEVENFNPTSIPDSGVTGGGAGGGGEGPALESPNSEFLGGQPSTSSAQ